MQKHKFEMMDVRSKSFNEALSMRIGMEYFKFAPDDIIIKITGRYVLETDEFIKFVKQNVQADIIARTFNQSDAYTGLFAIKTNVLVDFLDNHYLNLLSTEKHRNYGIEHAFGNYITENKNSLNILYIPKLYSYMPECLGRK